MMVAACKPRTGGEATYFAYHANQLIAKIRPPGEAATYFYYDGSLSRYCVDRAGTLSYFLWNGLDVMEERNDVGALVARYTYGYSILFGIGSCVEIFVPGAPDKTYFLAMDHRGTAHVLLDETQVEVGRRYYDAFGHLLGESGSWPVDLAYQTNWLTLQIGNRWWMLSRYRVYDPETATFISRDFLPYPNKYRAWSNNPVGQVDRDGLTEIGPGGTAATPADLMRERLLQEGKSPIRHPRTPPRRTVGKTNNPVFKSIEEGKSAGREYCKNRYKGHTVIKEKLTLVGSRSFKTSKISGTKPIGDPGPFALDFAGIYPGGFQPVTVEWTVTPYTYNIYELELVYGIGEGEKCTCTYRFEHFIFVRSHGNPRPGLVKIVAGTAELVNADPPPGTIADREVDPSALPHVGPLPTTQGLIDPGKRIPETGHLEAVKETLTGHPRAIAEEIRGAIPTIMRMERTHRGLERSRARIRAAIVEAERWDLMMGRLRPQVARPPKGR